MEMALSLATGFLVALNLASVVVAGRRMTSKHAPSPIISGNPPVSIVVPMRGIENFTTETLQAAFQLNWPDYELIFCVADVDDPVLRDIRKMIAAHPLVEVHILTGDDRISANPKLNNCVKGWRAARHDWVVLADSNVLMPADYVQHLLAGWRKNTGVVCSTPIGSRPDGFWAEVECMFLNTQQARWQYAGEAIGFGFAQGKSMLWYKPMLDANGGIQALNAEIAEDAAATKLVRRTGRSVHLVSCPFDQPLGRRSMHDVWSRQCRWARLRRVTFPGLFTPEIVLGAFPPLLLGLLAAASADIGLPAMVLLIAASIYLPEMALAAAKGWRLSRWSLPAMIVRDVMMPLIWVRSWIGGTIDWRGNTMTIGTAVCELSETPVHSA
ncbi:ceramide glucosyltransferase [Pararhizobium capsulatum DSM 1112]|uniref:Ceramide glucosyltransferase n=1 Tax=Pararhizobium capsulatum DSM 1112 TaxID=1121113 RepID=A0ABU0BWT3_9HYPH|nr:ceramide glucosyltransferase [Pararhizobium capsulatum]MDQ0322714.1 ceramide glucosyltransferase [Pararhizobium capsulatum DSM 1112]